MPKKLPYGQSNFANLIKSGYAYIDKTRYIELLENENNTYQFFIRPRRFGKSLFISILENYYGLGELRIENGELRIDSSRTTALFKDLYIGKNPTPEKNKYAVMNFDFSGLNTDSHEEFVKSFSNRVQECVRLFLERYQNAFSNSAALLNSLDEKNPGVGALDLAYAAAFNASVPIFAIIDEYDHFANNLIAMGKTYKDEVKAGGIVRTFYENLKIGTDSVVRRIFITGINPMMLNDLTSGFNMATDYSLFPKYNDMFGFTREEVEWLMQETGVDKTLIEVDMEAYYNGYMFNEEAKNKVYNSQMILFLFNQILRQGKQPSQIIDTNLQTDYERLRRLAENEDNREKLMQITLNGGIFGNIVEKFSLEKLESEEYFISLLFYMGMLTNGGMQRGRTWLKIPNYSIRTLYWEYIVSYVQNLEKTRVSTSELSNVIDEMAYDGSIKPYLDFFTENFLKRLSNRYLANFNEKYIKVMMLSSLFISRLYLPVSEDENINGYTDIYLQKHPAVKDIKFEYVFEIKYAKTDAVEAEVKAKFEEAGAQIERYKKDPRFAGREDVKFAALVFKGKGEYESRE
ncbi:MAG: ATP-binding protein [Fibromonadales bacterium]|nr:ATP-binding protein [Fibromonadales bacterium]